MDPGGKAVQRRQPSPNAPRRPVAPDNAIRWVLILASALSCTVAADHICEPPPSTIFDNIPVNADGTPSAFPEDGVIGLRRYVTDQPTREANATGSSLARSTATASTPVNEPGQPAVL